MESLTKLVLVPLLLLLVSFIDETRGDAMVTGTVFCDQCKDGRMSLFDYRLSGAKVKVTCDSWVEKQETTNWFGSYTVRFEGNPDLSGCYAHVLPEPGQHCGAAAGPAQQLKFMFRIFGMEMYRVDSLLSQPTQAPTSICPRSTSPALPPPRHSPSPSPPMVTFPPAPPFFQASACSHEIWTRAEYRCHWRFVQPDTKVGVAFGLIAARRYGRDMSLWQGIQGRGDIYRTLLREGTTALLNSYNSIQFRYPTLLVLDRMNWALMGTPRQALLMALRFKRANSGASGAAQTPPFRCNLTPCKAHHQKGA